MRKAFLSAAMVIALVTLGACSSPESGDSSGSDASVKRPSQSEIAKDLLSKDSIVPVDSTEAADCVAGVLHDSGLTNEALNALLTNDENYTPTQADQDAMSKVLTALPSTCGESIMGDQLPSDIPTEIPTS